jgi:hypothetical protein
MAAVKGAVALCTYRVKKGKEREFERLLGRHWPTLRKLGLVTGEKPLHFRGVDETEGTFYVEILSWKDVAAPSTAERIPEVMAVWERMGALVEPRLNRPPMEFPHVEKLRIALER